MSTKKQIKEILENIDNVAENSKYLHSVADEYRKVRDLYFVKLKDEKSAKRIQSLIDVLNFVISDNMLKEVSSGVSENGICWKYPDISFFTENGFKEVEQAFKTTKSIKLKARYSDFFWLSKKDYKKARIAFDNYFILIKKYEEADKKNPIGYFGLDVLDSTRRAFQISKSISYRQSDIIKEIERLSLNFNSKSSSKYKLVIDLVSIALNNKKEFKSEEFWQGLVLICEKYYKELSKDKNWYFSRDYLNNAKKIELMIFSKKSKKWDKLVAKSYLCEADYHGMQESLAELPSLLSSIEEYKKLKDFRKTEELKKRYEKASKNVRLKELRTEINISRIVTVAKNQANELCKQRPDEVFKYLLLSPDLFPIYNSIEIEAKKNEKRFVFMHLGSQIVFDQKMNIARRYCSKEEKHFFAILRQFGVSFIINKIYTDIIFEKLIEKNILTWVNTSSFLRKYCWYKNVYEVKNDKGITLFKSQKWLDLMAPGIKLYLNNAKKYLRKKDKKIPYSEIILASDSLAMKIEGVIREIFRKLGRSTFKVKRKGDENITVEKDLNDFLIDNFSEQMFSKDLTLLMRFLLIEPSGYNLRNNIGHCLIQKEDYNLSNLHFLFLILLRLGNYKF